MSAIKPLAVLMFGISALTSCVSQKYAGDFPKERYSNQIGGNGVRRMADPSDKEIKNALREHGTQDWTFLPEKDGYLYSEPVELVKNKRSLAFRYDGQNLHAVTFDPEALRQGEATTFGETKEPLSAEVCGASNFQILKYSAENGVKELMAKRNNQTAAQQQKVSAVTPTIAPNF